MERKVKVSHYNKGGIECINVMRSISSHQEFIGFLRCNTLKYIFRAKHKGTELADLKKALYYLDTLITEVSKSSDPERDTISV